MESVRANLPVILSFEDKLMPVHSLTNLACEPTTSEEQFRLLSNALPLSIIHTDQNGRAIYVNNKWEELSGLSAQESLRHGWQSSIHPDFQTQMAVCWHNAVQQKQPVPLEVRLATDDGTEVWLRVAVTTLGASKGKHNGFVWTFEDTSMHRLAEQNMKTQLEVTRAISAAMSLEDAAPDILSAICENMGWQAGVFWDLRSREHEEVLNIATLSRVVNLNCLDLVHNLSVAYDDLVIKETLRFRQPNWTLTSAEDDSYRKQLLVDNNISCRLLLPIVDNGRHVVALLELFGTTVTKHRTEALLMFSGLANQISDFTERVSAESKLRESDSKVRSMVDCAVDGIITVDTKGMVESFNSAFERMFGYEPWKLIGSSASEFLPDGLSVSDFVAFLESSADAPQEMYLKTKKGTQLAVEISVSKVGVDKTNFYTVIVRDVSERKIVEKRVSEFYSTVSHELRTPLTSIRGALGLVENGVLGEVSPDILELITVARGNSDRLIRLINDILDLRKIEAGKLELRLAQVNVQGLIEKTLAEIKGFADEKNISMTSEVVGIDLLTVDGGRIIQVLTNLISNAIKFSAAGQSVHVAVSRTSENATRFTVSDHGVGIQADDIPKLFGIFQQLDSSDTRANEGSGLGLAISKAIVEQHGGIIGLDSVFGEGTTFWFELAR
jgi:PAS domain S-box-containing protein